MCDLKEDPDPTVTVLTADGVIRISENVGIPETARVCPIFVHGYYAQSDIGREECDTRCIGEKCALWRAKFNTCALALLVDDIPQAIIGGGQE